jgi:hypothetical protein
LRAFLSASDLDEGDSAWVCRQEAIQGVILCINYVLFESSATKGLDQVRLLVYSKKAVLNFYVVFGNLDLVAETVSGWS